MIGQTIMFSEQVTIDEITKHLLFIGPDSSRRYFIKKSNDELDLVSTNGQTVILQFKFENNTMTCTNALQSNYIKGGSFEWQIEPIDTLMLDEPIFIQPQT